MRKISLRTLGEIPVLGQGTWFMGDDPREERAEIEALRTGIEQGMTLLDSAEMYGNGASERLVGKAIQGLSRDELFLVSKVLPSNAGKRQLQHSAERSMKNMGVDYLDLYLLHWKGSIPFEETIEEMEALVRKGKIRAWGVSNLDTEDMEEMLSLTNGTHCIVDQVLYHLGSRGVEYDLLPYLNKHNIALMAYCPLAQGGVLDRGLYQNKQVLSLAKKYDCTSAQILLAFVLSKKGVFAIPKASRKEHTLQNAAAERILLTQEDCALLNQAFPAPKRKTWLDIV